MSGFPKYIHLRVHTEYSLLEGATRLKKLPELCKANDMPAIALTETNNLFSALEFSVLFKDNGLQPIIGCQIDFRFTDMGSERRARTTAPIVLLAKDELGYKNLMKLSSEMYVQNDYEKSNGLENFELSDTGPQLFNSDSNIEKEIIEENFDQNSDDDELEIPAFLRRQKN